MKLLFITQVVDPAHPVLGFTCGWISALGKRCQSLIVVGQSVVQKQPAFAQNVKVQTLGKERGLSWLRQVIRFWRLLWRHRKEYDAVLVHMTPIWVILGFPVCMIARKPLYLWYEARGRGWNLRLALWMVRRVFSASPSGMPLATSRSLIVGHGIDTAAFKPAETVDPYSLITVSRITLAKRLPIILDALKTLPAPYRLTIVGAPVTEADRTLATKLQSGIAGSNLINRVSIRTCVHEQLPALLAGSALFLHAADTGLDKALLEAMACGVPVVSCSQAVQSLLPEVCRATPETFTARASAVLSLDALARIELAKELRETVTRFHSLDTLADRLVAEMR